MQTLKFTLHWNARIVSPNRAHKLSQLDVSFRRSILKPGKNLWLLMTNKTNKMTKTLIMETSFKIVLKIIKGFKRGLESKAA